LAGAFLFDIDGTLCDTNYLHALAWRRTFTEHGFDVPTAEIHRRVGMGSGLLMRELIGEEREDLKDTRRRYFGELKAEIRALPGARELLAEIDRRGGTVVLATSAEQSDVEALLKALDPGPHVQAVTSSADVDEAKPAPDVFAVALERAGARPEEALTVGDTIWDVQASARCGLGCTTVLTGGISRADLNEAGAVAVYQNCTEILEHLADTPIGRLLERGQV
jgi:HAD superfamily hydrolase (TIGR01509 family)